MEHVSVRLPEPLDEKVTEKAEEVGLSKSEIIRFDLITQYYD